MARRNRGNHLRRRSEEDFMENNENLINFGRPDPAYFSGYESCFRFTPSRVFVFSASLGIAILIGFAITCNSDQWTSVKQYKIVKADILDLQKELQAITKGMQEITPTIENVERMMYGLAEIRNFLSGLHKSIGVLKEDIQKEISGKTDVIMDALTDALIPIHDTIENGFKADGTGRVDFALESTGGKIMNTRNTETYPISSFNSFFGFRLCEKGNPQAIIQPGVLPGQCWAFKGSSGSAIIQLIGYVYVASVTLEHIPAVISPTGSITSAPRIFSIWGLKSEDDTDGFFFGQFTYDKNGTPKQTFTVQHQSKESYQYVELKVLSNHGEERYTCVYRLRVHGVLSGLTKPSSAFGN